MKRQATTHCNAIWLRRLSAVQSPSWYSPTRPNMIHERHTDRRSHSRREWQNGGQQHGTFLGPISWNPLRPNSVLTSTVKRKIYFMESVSKTCRLAEKFSANPDCFLLTRCQDTYKMAIGCRSRHYRGRLTFIEAKFYSLEF